MLINPDCGKAWYVAGYVFAADVYCPDDIPEALTGRRPAGSEADQTAEDWLDEQARQRGIDRAHEETFDSGDFPKIIFDGGVTEDDYCAICGDQL